MAKYLTHSERDTRWIAAQEMARQGMSGAEIARHYGFSRQRAAILLASPRPIPHYSRAYNIDGRIVRRSATGWIYIIESGNLFKLGFSKDVDRRLQQLRSSSAIPAKLRHKAEGTCREEKWMHYELLPYRHHAEWYRPQAYSQMKKLLKHKVVEARLLTAREHMTLQKESGGCG